MYFKISFDDQYANLGLINAVASYYLEEGDEGFEKYIKEFPNRTPFRHHEHQFNPDATMEEIQEYFAGVSDEMVDAYLDDDIFRLKNDAPNTELQKLPEVDESVAEEVRRKVESLREQEVADG